MSAAPRTDGRGDFRFSTDTLSQDDAFDRYRTIFGTGADVIRHADGFRAYLAGYEFTRMVVHHRRLSGIRHVRGARLVRRSDFSHFTLTLCLSGSIGVIGAASERTLYPGDIVLADMTLPGALHIDEAETITVAVAREVVEAATGDAGRLSQRVFSGERSAPLRQYLVDLVQAPRHVPLARLPEEEIAERLHIALAPYAIAPARRARARRLLTAHRIIEARLADPMFDADALGAAMKMSRATLYRLFEPLDGVASHLQARRLTMLRRLLMDGDTALALGPLVSRAGLVSESHASRIFLQRFGDRPGHFRLHAGTGSDVQRAALSMALWPDMLR